SYETREVSSQPNPKKGEPDIVDVTKTKHFPKIDAIKDLVNSTFNRMSYIGPLRDLPRDEYAVSSTKNYVGKTGENTAQILENFAKEEISYLKPTISEDGIIYTESTSTLIEAV